MRKLVQLIRRLLQEGLSPERASWAAALGLTLGVFPVYGPVTLVGLALAFAFRLNKPLVVAGCYAMTFVKPFLILPFLKLGEWLFQADPMPIGLVELSERFAAAPWPTLREFAASFMHAMAGWAVVVPAAMLGTYVVSMSVIRRWNRHADDGSRHAVGPHGCERPFPS